MHTIGFCEFLLSWLLFQISVVSSVICKWIIYSSCALIILCITTPFGTCFPSSMRKYKASFMIVRLRPLFNKLLSYRSSYKLQAFPQCCDLYTVLLLLLLAGCMDHMGRELTPRVISSSHRLFGFVKFLSPREVYNNCWR